MCYITQIKLFFNEIQIYHTKNKTHAAEKTIYKIKKKYIKNVETMLNYYIDKIFKILMKT